MLFLTLTFLNSQKQPLSAAQSCFVHLKLSHLFLLTEIQILESMIYITDFQKLKTNQWQHAHSQISNLKKEIPFSHYSQRYTYTLWNKNVILHLQSIYTSWGKSLCHIWIYLFKILTLYTQSLRGMKKSEMA